MPSDFVSSAEGANSAVAEKQVVTRNSFQLELPPYFDFPEKLCTINIKIVKKQLRSYALLILKYRSYAQLILK